MLHIKLLKKFFIPAGVGVVASVGDVGDETVDCTPISSKKEMVRRSELPIYIPESTQSAGEEKYAERGLVESAVFQVRKELWIWYDHCQGYREKLVNVMVNTKEQAEVWLEYLKEEDNVLPRAGAIGVSSLAGLVLGLRGGRFKKLLYGTAGGLTMAALCYPREAHQYSHRTIHFAKKYCIVGYHFIYGVTPDSLRSPLPSPADFSVVLVPEEDPGSDAKPEDPAAKVQNRTGLNRDQSNPADKDLYTNRQ